jgi:hypothetical protein
VSALDAWEAWLMLTCLLLIAVWTVTALVDHLRRSRRPFEHAHRVERAREQMRREVAS